MTVPFSSSTRSRSRNPWTERRTNCVALCNGSEGEEVGDLTSGGRSGSEIRTLPHHAHVGAKGGAGAPQRGQRRTSTTRSTSRRYFREQTVHVAQLSKAGPPIRSEESSTRGRLVTAPSYQAGRVPRQRSSRVRPTAAGPGSVELRRGEHKSRLEGRGDFGERRSVRRTLPTRLLSGYPGEEERTFRTQDAGDFFHVVLTKSNRQRVKASGIQGCGERALEKG
jgi:hypothetical protein